MKLLVAILVTAYAVGDVGSKGRAGGGAVPEVAATAKAVVADIHGTYTSPPGSVPSAGMPGEPVAGNGDIAIVMAGGPEHQTFYIGKADCFGVVRGGIMPVGSLALDVPQLHGSSYRVDENIATATLAGKFTSKDGSELSLNSWVSATQNLVVVALNNTGLQPLNFTSSLADGFAANGNQATFSSSDNSTALRVSPDSVNVEIGNRHHGGKPGAFRGQIADVRIFVQALRDSALSSLDSSAAPKALVRWQASAQTLLKGNATLDYGFPTPMIKVFNDRQQRTSSGGMNSSQAIFPAWAIGLESDTPLKEAAYNTVDFDSHWFDANNDCAFYPAAACIGYDPNAILRHLDELLETEFPSFIIPTRGGGTEDFAIVPATLCAMMIQSYQQNIHLFPNGPMDRNASFGKLNACGGFLISSQLSHGQVTYVQIESTAGQECRLMNPWPSDRVQLSSNQRAGEVFSRPLLKFATQQNEVLVLRPGP